MDSLGARHLVARIRAGVRVGTTIVLDSDDTEAGLVAGDRGVVRAITPSGVTVDLERGTSVRIDPQLTPFHPLEAL